MTPLKDLAGQRFGHLAVLEYSGKLHDRPAWKCRCDCGNEIVVMGKQLTSGQKTYCGCSQSRPSLVKTDLVNRKFGLLTVLYPLKDKPGVWHCKCDCGNEKDVRRGDLLSGNTKTCGASIHHMKNIAGQRFGSLIALEPVGKSSSRTMIWRCQCDCGAQVDVDRSSLMNGNVKSCGCKKLTQTDLTGKRYGKLMVLSTQEKTMTYDTVWHCRCDCGKETDLKAEYILMSKNPSCGCFARRRNITGDKYGFLTAIFPTDRKQGSRTIWHCRCDCGKERDVSISLLTRGVILTCGCDIGDRISNLKGIRFGMLVAQKVRKSKKQRIWKCVCDCGNEIEVEEYLLLHGGPRSCGCAKGNFRDYTGEQRGRLTAIRPTGEEKNHSPVYVWRCYCGNEVIRPVIQVSKGHDNMCEECLRKQNQKHMKIATAALEEVSINRVPVKTIREIVEGKLTWNNTSGVRGVLWARNIKKWVARGSIRGKSVYLGCFDDKEEAIKARTRFVERQYVGDLEKYDREHS